MSLRSTIVVTDKEFARAVRFDLKTAQTMSLHLQMHSESTRSYPLGIQWAEPSLNSFGSNTNNASTGWCCVAPRQFLQSRAKNDLAFLVSLDLQPLLDSPQRKPLTGLPSRCTYNARQKEWTNGHLKKCPVMTGVKFLKPEKKLAASIR